MPSRTVGRAAVPSGLTPSDLRTLVDFQFRPDPELCFSGEFRTPTDAEVRVRSMPAFQELFVSQRPQGATAPAGLRVLLDTEAIAGQLSTAVAMLTYRALFQSLEDRLSATESCIRELTQQFARPEPPARAVWQSQVETVKTHIEAIRGIFAEAFGVAPATVTVLPEAGERDGLTVAIDASTSPADVVLDARRKGARGRFYELLLDRIPQELVDFVDFEFSFPQA